MTENSDWTEPSPDISLFLTEQLELKKNLILETVPSWDPKVGIKYIGGVDISFINKPENKSIEEACVALVILDYDSLEVVYEKYQMVELTVPYIVGFLAFREVTHMAKLVEELCATNPELLPEIIMVDGNGILHPNGFGSASHLGVLIDIPTIGVSKNFLAIDGMEMEATKNKIANDWKLHTDNKDTTTSHTAKQWTGLRPDNIVVAIASQASPPHPRGAVGWSKLIGDSGTCWGAGVSNNGGRKSLYVSQGHRVSLETCMEVFFHCQKYRIPEPIRLADLGSREYIRKLK